MAINSLTELKNDFLIYAQEVNNNRSFPDARDGLKPGMRAALWEMFSKGYGPNKPHVKSAKITGGTIASWWPHGDGSVYESIVRMSQPWVNNIPEIDWHGANGSQLGGPDAASSRYTECRLAESVEDGFFTNIKKNAVDMIPNFSEDDEWPLVLPAIFPRLFINGSQGIGYTIAQEWELGNLNEFTDKVKEYLDTKKITCDNIYPDYPTGGIIINKDEIHTIYETGKGNVILRGKVSIEDNIIKITELPYQVYAEPFIQKVKDLVNAEQLSGIDDIYNKSDDTGLLIEIECSDNPEVILNRLYKLTDLQCTFSANQMALVDGIPKLLTLEDYIKVYIDHNIECIKREYQFDLDKAENRLEVVNGLLKAIADIDNIISTIKKSKSSEEARINLMSAFGFTENQARAIIDMRLGKLANLESIELNNEASDLNKTIDNCNKLLKSNAAQKKEFLNRLVKFTEKYGWERRTELTNVDIVQEKAIVKAAKPSNEQCIVALTKGNHIKRISLVNYKPQTKVISEEDRITHTIKVGVRDKFILISASGKMYKLQPNKIEACNTNSIGTDLNDLLNDRIVAIFSGEETEKFVFYILNSGLVKKMNTEDVFGISKNIGTTVVKLTDNDSIVDCRLVNDDTKIEYSIGKKQKVLDTSKFRPKGRNAGGVAGIKLKEGQIFEL